MGTNNLKIAFYEWSNLNSQPLGFLNVDEFKKFCNDCHITITSNNNLHLNSFNTVYATCKKGKSELILSGSYKGLKKNFSKHSKKTILNGI